MLATFTLSFDLELAWGEFYRRTPVDVARLLAARRALPQLLQILERRQVPATFAVVGHLLLEGCDGHPEMPSTRLPWRPCDWYEGDPRTDERRDPAWYAPSLVQAIEAAAPGHDIGAHGFSHVPLDDPSLPTAVVAAELAACGGLLRKRGAGGRSFVYPRNGIMQTELLKEHGFTCFRGVEPRWYNGISPALRKAAHMIDQTLACTPAVGRPRHRDGVVEAPSSMLFLSREGFRQRIPMRSRVSRAMRGLNRAIALGSVFHLWLHVEDLVPDTDRMLAGLDRVLAEVERRVGRSEMVVRTMQGLAVDAVATA